MAITINGTTGIAGVDGSASTPAVQGTDGNTGVFYPAADTVGVSTGGSERLRIDSSGNVGIGTSSPIDKLQVKKGTNQNLLFGAASTLSSGCKIESINDAYTANVGFEFRGSDFAWISTGSERMRLDTSGNLLFNSGYGSVATAYGCRAWVNFNGTGTVAIRASGNVTSITDNGVGDYSVNFTTAMPDANYGVSISGRQIAASNIYSSAVKSGTTPTASAVNIVSIASTGSAGDSDFIYVAIFR